MKYDGLITKPPLTEDTLEHWGIRGWTKKNHKYTRRERGKNGKWRYFYGQLKSRTRKITDKIDKDHDWLIDIFDRNITVAKDADDAPSSKPKTTKFVEKPGSSTAKEYKYYKRIKIADGKYRYFYSQAEYERYTSRINTLDKDYPFMQDVPVLSHKATAEDAAKDSDVGTNAGNCSSCSVAFELRMRGYDVTSRPDINGKTTDEICEMFEGLGGARGTSNNWYLDTRRPENQNYYRSGGLFGLKSTSEDERLQIAQNDLERTIKERGGDNQRGFITIGWTQMDSDENGNRARSGGSHIFNYVVENGEVKYYDSQKGDGNGQMGGEIDIKTYLDNTDITTHMKGSDGGWMTYNAIYRVDDKALTEMGKENIQYTPVEIHDTPEEKDARMSNRHMRK